MKYRKIMCPEEKEGRMYRAENPHTGEILECVDLAPLLRHIAVGLEVGDVQWKLFTVDF